MRRRFKLTYVVTGFLAAIISLILAKASVDVPITLADIHGAPSKVAMNTGRKRIWKARVRYIVRHRTWYPTIATDITDYYDIVGKLLLPPPAPTPPLPPVVPPPPPPPAKPLVYQNVAYRVVNPDNQGPVTGLHLVAEVHTASNPDQQIEVTTDEHGIAKVAKVGPIPAVVDIKLSPQYDNPGGEPEWRLESSEMSRLIFDEKQGNRVAEGLLPYRIASAVLPQSPNRHYEIYQSEPQNLVAERSIADVDVEAPASAVLTTPALPAPGSDPNSDELQKFTVPDSGHVTLKIPMSALGDGPIPIRVALETAGGLSESVISEYGVNAYATNHVSAPALQLVQVNDVTTINNAQILESGDDIRQAFGNPSGQGNSRVIGDPDGSSWWEYGNAGISFKMRPAPDSNPKRPYYICERIRLINHNGGDVAGISPGSTVADMESALGNGDGDNTAADPAYPTSADENVRTYLDRGIRICRDGTKVSWIEVARPAELLVDGTTAFVPRPRTKIFINSMEGTDRIGLASGQDLAAVLASMPSISIVENRQDADLVLDVHATFEERSEDLTSILPLFYSCKTSLSYSLQDPVTGRKIADNETVSSESKADYRADFGGGVLLMILGFSNRSRVVRELTGIIGVAGIAELHELMRQAVNRCPGISARATVDKFVHAIDAASDYHVRVIAADYSTGTLRMNVGRADGIEVSTPEKPFEFEVQVGDDYLPSSENGLKADYYSAEVVNVDDHTCDCVLHHIKRGVRDMIHPYQSDDQAIQMCQAIPDPTTGIVSARAKSEPPDISSLPAFNPAPAQQEGQGQPPTNNNNNGNSVQKAIGNLFGGMFHR